jgi:hypothetical protein
LHDLDAATPPPERLLQEIWYHQRLLRDKLKTLDGQAVRVLHPGFWNYESGPDFQNAVLQFDNAPARTGDIEVDICHSGWHSHGHDKNPAFKNVLLHVVWDADRKTEGSLPTLALKNSLDSPLSDLSVWLGSDLTKRMPQALMGQCSAPLRDLDSATLLEILRQAAQIRLRSKGEQFQARARQVGWEQALWEGLFRGLGYKNNVWPFQRLGELIPLLVQKSSARNALVGLQARLLGVAGLLPADLTRAQPSTDRYLREIWDSWWRDRAEFETVSLPRSMWRFNGIRPANHPQRRLALAAHWLTLRDMIPRLENWFTQSVPESQLLPSLAAILNATHDDYWSRHWTFCSARLAKPQPLLGTQRVTDLAINVIIPWLWVRAITGENQPLRQLAEHYYFAWPKGEDNAVLRLARERLLGSPRVRLIQTAGAQQGLLQIIRDFCNQSDSVCTRCQFPDFIRNLNPPKPFEP